MRDSINPPVRLFVCAAALSSLFAGIASGQQYIRLRPSFAAGEEFIYRRDLKLRQVMRRPTVIKGNTSIMDMTTGYRMRFLEDQRPDHHPIELTFLVLAHRLSRPIGLEYDSRTDRSTDDKQSLVAGALLDRPFQVVVRDDGSVESVTGLEEFVKNDFGVLPGDPVNAIVDQYRSLVSPKNLEQLLLFNLMKDAPDETLVGGTWQSHFDVPHTGSVMSRDLDMILKEVKLQNFRPVAHVTFEGTVSLGKSPDKKTNTAAQVRALTGSEEGTIAFDIARRCFVKVELKQNLRKEMRFRAGKQPMGVRRAVEQLTTLVLERTSLADLMRPPVRMAPPETPAAAPNPPVESPPTDEQSEERKPASQK